ncbi:uncharacterized protein EDB91DRAFT_557321 [Suillus paluster]|uniref:uncharacterized protein n=1 Tax=Suillus paluster TaxID=48578 RepID=UPI001B8689BC|nr:uncharacterized protein EDB91DRAFT_557321 [Suillus paluster]KAG1735625.1 hypothetical protein EDB91DRAFT_557321 [Suillus paluster]
MLRVHGTSNAMSFFVTLLCTSQVYASCNSTGSCGTPSFFLLTIIGLIIIIAILAAIWGIIRRRRRLRRQCVAAAHQPAVLTIGNGTPGNNYGRPQSNDLRLSPAQTQCPPGPQLSRPVPAQMNPWNRQGVTPVPSFPQPSHSSLMTYSAHTRSLSMPSLTYHSHPNQTPHDSPPSSLGSSNQPGSSSQLPSASSYSHSPPPAHSRVSANISFVETPSIIAPAAYPHPHSSMPTSAAHRSPSENMEVHSLTVNTAVMNDKPPPACTPK